MSESIPDDIMKAAEQAWFEADEKIIKLDAIAVIAKAIHAERERCAKVCEDWPDNGISYRTLWNVAAAIHGRAEPQI